MTKLAANLSMMFTEVDMLDRFGAAANAGFKGVEYLFPYDYPAEQIREKLDQNGLEQVLFDFPAGDWAAGERGIAALPDRVGEFQDGIGTAVEYAKALGCERLTVLAGKSAPGVSGTNMQETLIDNLTISSSPQTRFPVRMSLCCSKRSTRSTFPATRFSGPARAGMRSRLPDRPV